MSKRSRLIWIIVSACVVGGGILVYSTTMLHKSSAAQADAYSAEAVTRRDIAVTVPASGQFQPTATTTVRPDPNLPQRQITQVLVAVGDAVKAGQVVARVDTTGLDIDLASARANYDAQVAKLNILKSTPTSNDILQAESQLRQATISLQSAQSNLESTQNLVNEGLGSQSQLLDARKQLDAATAALEGARYNLDQVKAGPTADLVQAQVSAVSSALSSYRKAQIVWDATSIRTPVAGTVAQVGVNVGDLVSATSVVQVSSSGTNEVNSTNAICVIIQNDPAVLQALVDETDVSRIRVGQKAVVTPAAFPSKLLAGTVSALAQETTTTQNVTTLAVSITVPNPDGRILWGMNADAEITILERKNVLTVPSTAIQKSGSVSLVNVENGTSVVPSEVKTGASDGTRTEIVAGLNENDIVLIAKRGAATGAGRPGGGNLMFRAMR